MKVTVGGREVITSAMLQVPNGEDAWVEFQAGIWGVRLNVKFVDTPDDPNQYFELDGKDDHATLTLRNWNNNLPSALSKPFTLGETQGRKVVFLFSGYAVSNFKRLDISFYWENANVK
jgi:hypothetical protein